MYRGVKMGHMFKYGPIYAQRGCLHKLKWVFCNIDTNTTPYSCPVTPFGVMSKNVQFSQINSGMKGLY